MRGLALAGSLGLALMATTTVPHTTTYQLNSYGFGSGGTANSHTTTYALAGQTGDLNGQTSTDGSTTKTEPGYTQTLQANVPKLSDLDNDGGIYYNELHFVIDQQNNPSNTKYSLAISSDNFVTDTEYVQSDGTLSNTFNATNDYQTDAFWGGSSGSLIIGLLPGTAYTVKVRASQGQFTESAYGPSTTVSTGTPSITFSLTTSTQSTPPFSVDLGSLGSAGFNTINTTAQTINNSLTTNGASGGNVYITGQNGGLKSAQTGNQINAVSGDLSTLSDGFGAQNVSVGQTAGGPFTVLSPYSVTGTNVGIINSTARSLYTSANPVTAGVGSLVLKAKAAKTDVAAPDYQETLTFVAAGNF
jgi:hypothetical protein